MKSSLTIEQWLDALRGDPQSATHANRREVSVLREIITTTAARHIHPASSEMRERFHAYLRDQSAKSGPNRDPRIAAHVLVTTWWRRLTEWTAPNRRMFAIAGLMLVCVVAIPLVYQTTTAPPEDDDAVVMRGDEQPQRIAVPNSNQRADAIAALLTKRGIRVFRSQAERSVVLQAKVPADDAATRAALEKEGVAVPPHGRLNLVLKQR